MLEADYLRPNTKETLARFLFPRVELQLVKRRLRQLIGFTACAYLIT